MSAPAFAPAVPDTTTEVLPDLAALIAAELAPKVVDIDIHAQYPREFMHKLGAIGGFGSLVAQAAKAAKAFFFALFGLVSMLLMWLGSLQTSAPRSLATGNRAASVQRWGCQYGAGVAIAAVR